TIQLARIFTASAPCAVAPARSTVKVSTHRKARMSSPVGYQPLFARDDTTAGEGRPRRRLVPRTRRSRTPCGKCGRERRVQGGTRIIELRGVLKFRSSNLTGRRLPTNFGIGPLFASS